MRTAKEFFKEEMAGEPLTEEIVIEGLNLFAKQLLEEYTNRIVDNIELVEHMQTQGLVVKDPFNSTHDFYINKESITRQLSLLLKKLNYE